MKTLYLHIGWRKNGSSAIQSYVTRAIKNDHLEDISVPPIGQIRQQLVAGDTPLAHHLFANFKRRKTFNQKWDEFVEIVKKSDDERFLLTSELFSANLAGGGEMLKLLSKRLEIFDRIVVPCWVRRQDQYMASIRAQAVKHGRPAAVLRSEVKRFTPDANYMKITNMISTKIKNVEILPHLYTRGVNVIGQFCAALDIQPDAAIMDSIRSVNSSVSPEMYKYQGDLNTIATELEIDGGKIQVILLRAWEGLPPEMKNGVAMPMSITERRIILEHFQQANERFCKRYGFDPAYFNPTEEELLKESEFNIPDKVSPEFKAAIRAQLEVIKPAVDADAYERLMVLVKKEAERAN